METRETAIDIVKQENNDKYRKISRMKRRKKLIKFFLTAILLMVIIVCLALSPLFSIRRIEVYGNKNYNNNEIIDASGLVLGNNWFRFEDIELKDVLLFRSSVAEANIVRRFPLVKSAYVRLKAPWIINITLTERESVAVIPYLGTNILIDREGYVLDTVDNPERYGLPSVLGVTFENYSLGQALRTERPERIEAFNGVMDRIRAVEASNKDSEHRISAHLKYVDVTNLEEVHINLGMRLTVNLGSIGDINNYKFNFLREIYFFNMKPEEIGYLDLTTDKPSFIPDDGSSIN